MLQYQHDIKTFDTNTEHETTVYALQTKRLPEVVYYYIFSAAI